MFMLFAIRNQGYHYPLLRMSRKEPYGFYRIGKSRISEYASEVSK